MDHTKRPTRFPKLIVYGFIAGFLATLVFHQAILGVLWLSGVAPAAPYALKSTPPFGVPAVISLAFWGGLWGVLFSLVQTVFPGRRNYWWAAFVFGALFPSLLAWLVVLPLKGLPAGGGWRPLALITALVINGVWGMGTGLIIRLLAGIPQCGITCGLPVRLEPTSR